MASSKQTSFGQRLGWACLVSVLVNLFLWWDVAGFVRGHSLMPPPPLEIQRILLPKVEHRKPKTPKKIVKPKPVVKPKPTSKPNTALKPKTVFLPRPILRPKPLAPPPPATHNRVLVSQAPGPATHTALPGGHAQIGKPIEQQNVGEGRDNNQPPLPTPVPQPAPPPKPEPPPLPKPEPVGPTQDAQFDPGPSPDIPDDLKSESFQSFVRVRVVVRPDGSFTPILRTSSGNSDIDRLVLDALKQHGKAKPALQNGVPVESIFLFKYEFEVE